MLLVDVIREPGGGPVAATAGRPWEKIRMMLIERERAAQNEMEWLWRYEHGGNNMASRSPQYQITRHTPPALKML